MGKMNINRVDSKDLEDVNSIDSSNVDYAEIFEEKFSKVDIILERTNIRINKVIELIGKLYFINLIFE